MLVDGGCERIPASLVALARKEACTSIDPLALSEHKKINIIISRKNK